MEALQAEMTSGSPSHTVVQADAIAHVLAFDAPGGLEREGYAVFSSGAPLVAGARFVSAADTPILAMAERSPGGSLLLSIVNPDLALQDIPDHNEKRFPFGESAPTPVQITLRGTWILVSSSDPGVELLPSGSDTVLTITPRDGLPVDLELD